MDILTLDIGIFGDYKTGKMFLKMLLGDDNIYENNKKTNTYVANTKIMATNEVTDKTTEIYCEQSYSQSQSYSQNIQTIGKIKMLKRQKDVHLKFIISEKYEKCDIIIIICNVCDYIIESELIKTILGQHNICHILFCVNGMNKKIIDLINYECNIKYVNYNIININIIDTYIFRMIQMKKNISVKYLDRLGIEHYGLSNWRKKYITTNEKIKALKKLSHKYITEYENLISVIENIWTNEKQYECVRKKILKVCNETKFCDNNLDDSLKKISMLCDVHNKTKKYYLNEQVDINKIMLKLQQIDNYIQVTKICLTLIVTAYLLFIGIFETKDVYNLLGII